MLKRTKSNLVDKALFLYSAFIWSNLVTLAYIFDMYVESKMSQIGS